MKKKTWPLKLLGFSVICLITYFFAKVSASSWENLANADFTTFWLAGKSVLQGFDAYNSQEWLFWRQYYGATWIFNPTFIYPLPLRILLTPIALLPLHTSYLLWAMISQFIIIVSIYLVYTHFHSPEQSSSFPFILFGAFMFHPTILVIRFGQISPWLLIILVGAMLLWEKGQWFYGGAALSLLILKPTIGALYILFALVWLLVRKLWRGVAGLAVGGIALLILGLIQDPLWVMKFLQAGNVKMGDTFAYGPNVWGIARFITGGEAIIMVGGGFSLILIAAVTWYTIKNYSMLTPTAFISLITPVVLLITPYIWGYDQVFLLIPLIYLVLIWEERNISFLIRSLFLVMVGLFSYLLILPTRLVYYDYFSFLLPLFVLVLFASQFRRQIRYKSSA